MEWRTHPKSKPTAWGAPVSKRLTSPLKALYLNASFVEEIAPVELKDIKAIIDLMKKNDLSVFEMEKDGFRLKLQKGLGGQPIVTAIAPPTVAVPVVANGPAAGASTAAAPQSAEASGLKDIVSPMVGTFYAAASPDAPPYVAVGQEVTEDTVVGIIEAMKVMNEIKAEAHGVIAEIVAENGKPVQYGQPLFRIR